MRSAHRPFTVEQFAPDAAAVLERLQAVPAHVVGLSMGGMIAFQVLSEFLALHTAPRGA